MPVSACEYRIPSRRCADLLLFFPRHITLSPHNFRVLVQPVLVGQYPFSEPRFFLTCNMGDLSGSARFRPLFESALQAYEKETGIALAEHPFAVQLQSCPSAESITTVLQDQANAFSEFGGYCRIMRSVTSTVSILIALSTTGPLSDALGLVRHWALMSCSTSLMFFIANPTCQGNTCWPCDPTCCMYFS